MSDTQKILLGVAVVTLLIALVMYFCNKDKDISVSKSHRTEIEETPVDSIPQERERIMVMFFSPGCGYCEEMMPDWDEFMANFDGLNNVRIIKVNGQENPQLCQLHNIVGFPTIKLCFNGLEDGVNTMTFNGDRSVQGLAQFLQENA